MLAIQQYWSLPYSQQREIQCNTKTTVLTKGANIYWVIGTLRVEFEEFCACEYCQGHPKQTTVPIDELVAADNLDQALSNIIAQHEHDVEEKTTWKTPPEVKLLSIPKEIQ